MKITLIADRGVVHAVLVAGVFCLSCASSYASTITVDDLGDGGPGNCAVSCTLRDAIATAAQGDTIQFAPADPPPWVVTLSRGELFIYKSVNILGPGADQLAIDAQQQSRLVEVALNADVAISGIHFTNGAVFGTAGTASTATSGATPGGPAYGGAFLVNPGTSLTLQESVIDSNQVLGGTGGAIVEFGTQAANGGNAYGGAIYNSGLLKILRASLVNNQTTGGVGGADELFLPGASAGGAGGDAFGGAIAGPGQVELTNAVIAGNLAAGGNGGFAFLPFPGIVGGNAGNGEAGAIDADGIVILQFVTMAQNVVAAGQPGFGGISGSVGTALAADVLAGSTVLSRSSIVASDGGSCVLNGGSFALQGVNYNSDGTCPGFTVATNLLKPLAEGLNGYLIAFPVYKSPVIDAALDCEDAFGTQLTNDVEGVSRPQGSACDVGAVESDYVFADGFEP